MTCHQSLLLMRRRNDLGTSTQQPTRSSWPTFLRCRKPASGGRPALRLAILPGMIVTAGLFAIVHRRIGLAGLSTSQLLDQCVPA